MAILTVLAKTQVNLPDSVRFGEIDLEGCQIEFKSATNKPCASAKSRCERELTDNLSMPTIVPYFLRSYHFFNLPHQLFIHRNRDIQFPGLGRQRPVNGLNFRCFSPPDILQHG